VTSAGVYNYAYDNDGNLTSQTDTATGITDTYTYDYRNRLISDITTNSSDVVTQSVTYTYSAATDQLISETVNNGEGTLTSKTWFIYDTNGNLLMTLGGDGGITSRYLFDPDGNLLAQEDVSSGNGAGTVYWALEDQDGSVNDVIDSGGDVLNNIVYDSFGNVASQTSTDSAYALTVGYADMMTAGGGNTLYFDPNSGEFYNPTMGGYISVGDGSSGGGGGGASNPYTYGGNSPVTSSASGPAGQGGGGNGWSGGGFSYSTGNFTLDPLGGGGGGGGGGNGGGWMPFPIVFPQMNLPLVGLGAVAGTDPNTPPPQPTDTQSSSVSIFSGIITGLINTIGGLVMSPPTYGGVNNSIYFGSQGGTGGTPTSPNLYDAVPDINYLVYNSASDNSSVNWLVFHPGQGGQIQLAGDAKSPGTPVRAGTNSLNPFDYLGGFLKNAGGVVGSILSIPLQVSGEGIKHGMGVGGAIAGTVSPSAGAAISGGGNQIGNAVQGAGTNIKQGIDGAAVAADQIIKQAPAAAASGAGAIVSGAGNLFKSIEGFGLRISGALFGPSGHPAPRALSPQEKAELLEYAKMARAVYDEGNGKQAEDIGHWHRVDGGRNKSNLAWRLYYNKETHKYVLVFKGTEGFSSLGDWVANFFQAIGFSTDQYNEAIALAQQYRWLYGANLEIVGHSLGGGLAAAAALSTGPKGAHATVFNPAGVNAATLSDSKQDLSNANAQIKSYVVVGEILTSLEDNWLWLLFGILPHAPHSNGAMTTLNPQNGPPNSILGDEVKLHGMDSVIDAIKAAPTK
jgi:YD repeat-containing protein